MLVYRVTKHDPPTEEDMLSAWELGRRPDPLTPGSEAVFREVSTFNTPQAAALKAQAFGLGDYIATLDIPDTVTATVKETTGHVGLAGATPEELLGYVQNVQPVDDVLH